MKYIIDRFEGDMAVCEDEGMNHTDIHKSRLPEGIHEGDAFEIDGNGLITPVDDLERKRRIAEKMKAVWR